MINTESNIKGLLTFLNSQLRIFEPKSSKVKRNKSLPDFHNDIALSYLVVTFMNKNTFIESNSWKLKKI